MCAVESSLSAPISVACRYAGRSDIAGLPFKASLVQAISRSLLHRYTAAVRTQFLRCQILSAVPQIAAMPRFDIDNGAWRRNIKVGCGSCTALAMSARGLGRVKRRQQGP
jgi:hypothetical protein